MGILNIIGITSSIDNKASNVFESLFPSFFEVKYSVPSEYITKYWNKYLSYAELHEGNNNLNGKIFEYVLATLFIREKILPLFLSAKVAFVPNVLYDMLLYCSEIGPICISAKTSLRERYKQADLEAIALKYVHRKSLSYLLTLNEAEANNIKVKIKKGDVIGIDEVIVASKPEFNKLIKQIKVFELSDPPTVKVISSSQVITLEKIKNIV